MTKWIDGNDDYRTAYYDCIASSRSLNQEILRRISAPEAWSVCGDYFDAKPRLLVLGQETYGSYTPLAEANAEAAFATQMQECKSFDYAIENASLNKRSKFWQAFDEIKETFGFASRRHIGWSNLIKVQMIESQTNSRSVAQNFSSKDVMEIVRWQRELFRAEFAFFRPQAVLMLTGGVSWMLSHIFENVRFEEDGIFNVVRSDEINVPVVQTYHPNARPNGDFKRVVAARNAALQYLLAALASGRTH